MGNTLDVRKCMDQTQVFEGQNLPPTFAKIKDECANFDVRDSDIWLCCFPKTGSTWLLEMLWLVANDYDYEGAKVNSELRTPYFERAMCGVDPRYIELVSNSKDSKRFVMNSISILNDMESPRVIKTHLNWNNLPKQIKDGTKSPKIVYVTRNPKDTCISMLHFSKLLFGTSDTIEEACEKFINDKVPLGPFFEHVLPLWARRKQLNVLFLTYEEMKTDIRGVILKVVGFLEKTINNEQMAQLLDHLSMDKMRQNKTINNEELISMMKRLLRHKYEGKFINKGKVGNFKEVMSPELIEKFDNWTKEQLRGTGLKFEE